jgi:RNA polymerase sigma-70 factor (ECF subfamily)
MAHPLRDPKGSPRSEPGADEDTTRLVEALVRRDEDACRRFLDETRGTMIRIARAYVGSREIAEEVVQESWVAMLRGIESFEGRSSVRTWLFSILIRRARSVGERERRTEAVSQLIDPGSGAGADPTERFFHGAGHPDAGSWALPPSRWRRSPENIVLDREVRELVTRAIDELPDMQRLVVLLRDVEGWKTAEIARQLDRTSNWVRVVLHRGRFKVRAVVQERLGSQE